ncbi:MAG: lipoate-protein ligase B, partial [Hyphomicrobiaceae bacterium]
MLASEVEWYISDGPVDYETAVAVMDRRAAAVAAGGAA